MKAIIYTRYGSPDVLQLKDVPKPVPKENEVLVKVSTASLNAADWHLLSAKPFIIRFMGLGFFKPKNQILGANIAGRIEAVGKNVKQFHPGDEVYGDLTDSGWGGLAEYVCTSENTLASKPANITFEEAAAVPMAALTALQGLRDEGEIKQGQKVLINGASGGVGTFAVQIAKSFGAEVTAVCSTQNMEMARSLGADHVIDYTKKDFTASGIQYDLILAANGFHPLSAYKRALSSQGIYVMSGGTNAQMFQSLLLGPLMSKKEGKKMRSVSENPNKKDLAFMNELLESGKVKSVIDKRYPLHEAPDAFRYLESGHAKGKIVITMEL